MKKIDYFSIIKEAVDITKKNKVLWWFGFLAIFGGFGSSSNFNFSGDSFEGEKFDEMERASMMRNISFYWENYSQWIILAIIIIFILGIVFYVLGLIGKGAMIDSTIKVIKNEKVTFSSGFKRGLVFLKKMFLLNVIFIFSFLVSVFILFFPVIRLIILKSYGSAIFLGIIAAVLMISISILFFYLARYAQIYLVSSNVGVIDSLKLAYRLFEKNIGESLLMGLVIMAMGLVLGIGISLGFIIILAPAGLLGFLLYNYLSEKIILIVLGILFGLFVIMLSFFISSVLNVFYQTIWLLFFNQIAKSRKDQEEEVKEGAPVDIIKNGEVEPNMP